MSPRSLLLANMATSNDAESDGISEEIELLQAIYVHEIELIQGPDERPTLVNLFLHPSTGDDDHGSKYVCLNLSFSIPHKYPFISPGISINNPRGLSDAHVTSIQENLIALAKEKNGSPMLYDLIEYAKECLSDNNIPSCPCVICLAHFQGEEKFVKTECYHYFHTVCLGNYVDHFLGENENNKIVCPMCRLEIAYNKNAYETENDITPEEIFVYKPDKEQLEAQAERQRIFEYQQHKGGIINIEEEKKKYLIGIKDTAEGETGESNGVEPERILMPLVVSGQTSGGMPELSRESVRPNLSHSVEQSTRNLDEVADGVGGNTHRNTDRNKARGASSRENGLENNDKNMPPRVLVDESQREDSQREDSQGQTRDRDSRRRDNGNQRRIQMADKDDSGIKKGQAKNNFPEETNIGRKNFRDVSSQKGRDGRTGSPGTSKGYQGETVDSQDSSSGREHRRNPPELRKTGENRRRNPTGRRCETKGQYKHYSRAVDEGMKPGTQVQGNSMNSPSPSDNRRRYPENSKEQRREDGNSPSPSDDPSKNSENSKEQRRESREDRNEARKVEMSRKGRDFNSRRKDKNAQDKNAQDKSEIIFTEQPKESKRVAVSLKEEHTNDGGSVLKEGRDTSQTNELKSGSTPSDLSGNVEFSKQRENERSNARKVTLNNNSRQNTNKQPDRNQNQRNPRSTKTPAEKRRPHEDTKDCKETDRKNYRKTYSSVTSISNHRPKGAKKSDLLVSGNPKKSLNKNEGTLSANIGVVNNESESGGSLKETKRKKRRPPPGFENVRLNNSVDAEQNVSTKQSAETASDRGVVTRENPPIRRPPPGFENVTPKNI